MEKNYFPLFVTGVGNTFNIPLYAGAPLSMEASWYAIYQYAVSNKLSYQATTQLLELIRIHCPSPNLCPKSLYLLKKHLSNMKNCTSLQYCSHCMGDVPTCQKYCSKRDCKKSGAQLCYLSILPFEEHIKDLFSGMPLCMCTKSLAINLHKFPFHIERVEQEKVTQDMQSYINFFPHSREVERTSIPVHSEHHPQQDTGYSRW